MKVFFSFSSSQVLLEWLKELPLSWNLFLILKKNQHQISLWKLFLPSHLIQQYLLLSQILGFWNENDWQSFLQEFLKMSPVFPQPYLRFERFFQFGWTYCGSFLEMQVLSLV